MKNPLPFPLTKVCYKHRGYGSIFETFIWRRREKDGTTRLYVSYICPYAQRTWIARNYKGLQEQIKLVALDLGDRLAWYKEKLYPENKVPSLEHNNEVKGESLDLIKYIDTHFEGPALLPDDPAKQTFAEELLTYSDSFNKAMFSVLLSKGDDISDAGTYFIAQYRMCIKMRFAVDIAYAPFIERLQIYLSDLE
ncbi:Protein IN2-1 [Carex littledalei]|uniref:Protein IN2-1 n=1 Tax=Carex littledalei TaxID=544730 RepID=A0A833VHE3_9POAL|nr:Protein IN2-1 [Carex littledalei]